LLKQTTFAVKWEEIFLGGCGTVSLEARRSGIDFGFRFKSRCDVDRTVKSKSYQESKLRHDYQKYESFPAAGADFKLSARYRPAYNRGADLHFRPLAKLLNAINYSNRFEQPLQTICPMRLLQHSQTHTSLVDKSIKRS